MLSTPLIASRVTFSSHCNPLPQAVPCWFYGRELGCSERLKDGPVSYSKRWQMRDLNSGPPEAKVCLSTTPRASNLGPGWEQSTEHRDPGPHQVCGCAAPLPCEKPHAQAPAFKSGSKVLMAQQRALSLLASRTVTVVGKSGTSWGKIPQRRPSTRCADPTRSCLAPDPASGVLSSQEHFH